MPRLVTLTVAYVLAWTTAYAQLVIEKLARGVVRTGETADYVGRRTVDGAGKVLGDAPPAPPRIGLPK